MKASVKALTVEEKEKQDVGTSEFREWRVIRWSRFGCSVLLRESGSGQDISKIRWGIL